MSRGHIARASRRYPDARRRAARYGRTQAGRRPTGLPPHLLPGITGRAKKDTGTRLRLALATVLIVLLAAIAGLVSTVSSTVAGVSGTLVAYREVNEGLPNAGQVVADTYQTTRILDRNGKLLWERANPAPGTSCTAALMPPPRPGCRRPLRGSGPAAVRPWGTRPAETPPAAGRR